jgi:hypothetical protein
LTGAGSVQQGLSSRRRLVVLAFVVIASAGFAAGYLARGSSAPTSPTGATGPGSPFVVTGVTVRLAPGTLSCPSAVAHLTAKLTLDHGGGTVRYQWLVAGTVSAPQVISVGAGQDVAEATLAYKLTGRGSLTGTAVLRVISPLDAFSAPTPIHYSCIPKPKPKPKPTKPKSKS